ncbi:PHB depolymerase family esterase [Polaromonas sp. SM01]|uniref:extracellular catalytic domain type 1 short-chain-length polyhydroxyalkanoate depolymerase n=1 Tax=Polaromonas sp. SM01 TaxID=3085630 RepID=UPI002982292B|nr:PHB depolymerase family esterase [Polaromonas sp. SM01]MDW5441601.1 PHB depolymerase family esterase [Polaromonas sp. SM01]
MPRSLSSLWLKNLRRLGKAQQAQGRRLFKSLLPPAVRAPAARRPSSAKVLKPVKVRKARAARPVQRPASPSLIPAAVPGVWRKTWFSWPGASQVASARRMLYWLYLPSGAAHALATPLPLVVMLHGCQQTASDFATATRMNALAERKGFAVLYPQQSAAADAHRCWHWYKRATQQGQGDVRLVADMIAHVQQRYSLDTTRTYMAGLSAGAALANLVALRHPGLIAAVGLHSAPVFGTTDSAMSAYRAMQHGSGAHHSDSAQAFADTQPLLASKAGMPVILIHGDQDKVVRRINAQQLMQQFRIINAAAITRAEPVQRRFPARPSGRLRPAYQTATYYAGRKPQLVLCEVDTLGHAWSGGDASVAFSAAEGPDATLMMWSFFARHRRQPMPSA